MTVLGEVGNSKLVGRALGISSKTIDVHVQRVINKLGVRNRVEAVVAWDRWIGRMPLPELSEIERVRVNGVLLHRLRALCSEERKAA